MHLQLKGTRLTVASAGEEVEEQTLFFHFFNLGEIHSDGSCPSVSVQVFPSR